MKDEYSLENVREFNNKVIATLKQDNEIEIDPYMVEDVVEYAEQSMKWTDHKWKVRLSTDNTVVTRDGKPLDNIISVASDYDTEQKLPKLIISCYFNGFDIEMASDGAQRILYEGDWIEEVQKYEIINDPKYNFKTVIRLTIIGDIDMKWDYCVERGERENPNTFIKINYHRDPLLTSTAYDQATGEKLLEGEINE